MDCCQLRICNTLRLLWLEHVIWTRFFILSTAFNLPDLEFVTQRLLQNPNDFARELKPFYGEKSAMTFNQLLTDHLLIAAQLVSAAKAGDMQQVEEYRKRWYENAEDIAKFLAYINRFWSKARWQNLMFEHLRMTENEAAYILSEEFEKGINEYGLIQTQALEMADVMCYGIIRQFKIL